MKYIAIKIIGFDHLIWFEKDKYTEKCGEFKGTEGWGRSGAATSITCKTNQIVSRIESNELQYT